jgi:hypothetical protein
MSDDDNERERQQLECPECEHTGFKSEFTPESEDSEEESEMSWGGLVVLVLFMFVLYLVIENGLV